MTVVVKIRCSLQNREKWKIVLCILRQNDINCSKLISGSSVFTALCNSMSDADRIFSDRCLQELSDENCQPVMPPDLKAKRCVLASRLDTFLVEFSSEELIKEINEQNSYLEVVEIIKLSSGKLLKIVFKNQDMASMCLVNGILLFNLNIPPSSLRADEFFKISYCYKCYAIEDHTSRDCCKPSEYKICSICSSLEHTYKDCKATDKKCVNCNGQHNTMAYSCPARKAFMKAPAKTVATGSKFIYNAASNSYVSKLKSKPVPRADSDLNGMMLKSFMCFIYASNANASQPGSFSDVLHKLLKANNLPEFNMGDVEFPSFVIPSTMVNGNYAVPEISNYSSIVHTDSEDDSDDECAAELEQPDVSSFDMNTVPVVSVGCATSNGEAVKSRLSRKKSINCTVFVRKGYNKQNNGNIDNILNSDSVLMQHNCPISSVCRKYNGDLKKFISKSNISLVELTAKNFNTRKNLKSFNNCNLSVNRTVTRAGSASGSNNNNS